MCLSLRLHPASSGSCEGMFVKEAVKGLFAALCCPLRVLRRRQQQPPSASLINSPSTLLVAAHANVATGGTVPWLYYPMLYRSLDVIAGLLNIKQDKKKSTFPSFLTSSQSDGMLPHLLLTVATLGGQQQQLHTSSPPAGGQNGRTAQ